MEIFISNYLLNQYIHEKKIKFLWKTIKYLQKENKNIIFHYRKYFKQTWLHNLRMNHWFEKRFFLVFSFSWARLIFLLEEVFTPLPVADCWGFLPAFEWCRMEKLGMDVNCWFFFFFFFFFFAFRIFRVQ